MYSNVRLAGVPPKTLSVSIYVKGFFMLNKKILKEYSSYLKQVKYKHVLRELKLEYCTDDNNIMYCTDDDRTAYIHINIIRIDALQQQKGYGTKVMSDIIKFADEHQVRLELYASNTFGSSIERLYRFYGNLGFVWVKGNEDGKMIRPQKK